MHDNDLMTADEKQRKNPAFERIVALPIQTDYLYCQSVGKNQLKERVQVVSP